MQEGGQKRLGGAELFAGFFWAGLLGFGGVLPVARRMIVEQRRWLTQAEFNDLFALCQFLPGANIVNFAFAFGARQRGAPGAAAAVGGLLAAPVCVVMFLGAAYLRYGGLVPVRHALAGLAAAAAGLVLGSAGKIAQPILTGPRPVFIAAAMFAAIFLLRLPLPVALGAVLPLSLYLAWRAAR